MAYATGGFALCLECGEGAPYCGASRDIDRSLHSTAVPIAVYGERLALQAC